MRLAAMKMISLSHDIQISFAEEFREYFLKKRFLRKISLIMRKIKQDEEMRQMKMIQFEKDKQSELKR